MDYHFIKTDLAQQVASITLSRVDKHNAMHSKMIEEILHAIKLFEKNTECHLLMLKGEGKHFCSGADIKGMQAIANGTYEQNFDDAQYLADLMYVLYHFSKPTMVLAHGATMGGGLGLLAACDIALASEDAFFSFSEVKIGITPSTISPYIVKAIGERAAKYYFLTAQRFDATQALQLGLLQHVYPESELQGAAEKIAQSIITSPAHALTSAKKLVQHVANKDINEILAQKTAEHLAHIRSKKETRQAIDAFIKVNL